MVATLAADRILDCGHRPSAHGPHTTGTAHTADKREICWECADKAQRDELDRAITYSGYLSEDGYKITTWSGGNLLNCVSWVRKHNLGQSLTYWNGVDRRGGQWYGKCAGKGMSTTMHRRKGGRA